MTKHLLSVTRRFPRNPQRAEILQALLEFHKGDDHAFVYENEVLFGTDEVGGCGRGYVGDVLTILRAN